MAKKKTPAPDIVLVPLVTIDNDASASPLTREAGAALVWLCKDDRRDEVTELMMDARNDLSGEVDKALGEPESEMASVLTDIAVRHVISKLTSGEVIKIIQANPELTLGARSLVAAVRAKRSAA